MNPQMLMQLIQAMGQQRGGFSGGQPGGYGGGGFPGESDPGMSAGGAGYFGPQSYIQSAPDSSGSSTMNQTAPVQNSMQGYDQYQQQRPGFGTQQSSLMNRMRQMQPGGYGNGGWGQGGFSGGQGGYGGGGYGGGWNDIVGRHMMQRQQMQQPQQRPWQRPSQSQTPAQPAAAPTGTFPGF